MKKFHSFVLLALGLTTPFYATDVVVENGETRTTIIDLNNEYDRAIIEAGGTLNISASNSDGIKMNNNYQTTLNRGLIEINSINYNNGINNIGSYNIITNSGTISMTGTGTTGIYNSSTNNIITNSGTISMTGTETAGFINYGSNNTITNSGTISMSGTHALGIYNSGANNNIITNSGTISMSGDSSYGIASNLSSNNIITNSGTISMTGTETTGIYNTDVSVTITNSGTISATTALDLEAATSQTLNLLRGSNIQGNVYVGNTNVDLNVETGLNLMLTLDPSSPNTFGSLGIDAPYVLSGQTVAVIDPTGLALQADVTADLSDTIFDGIYRHRLGCCTPCGCGFWAQGFGSYRSRSHDSNYVGYDNWQGGFLLGYDRNICGGNAALFAGISFAEAEVDQRTQEADANTYFVGITYENTCCRNTFLGLSFAAGYIDWDNDRYVMNNLASNGVEKAHADIDGAFVSTDITLSRWFNLCQFSPITTINFRYAGLFLGDYHEKGSSANLSVKDRDIDLLTTRFEVALPYSDTCNSFCWSFEPYTGVFGRYQVRGYRVDGSLLGQSIEFNQEGPRNLAAFLLGFRGNQSFGCLNLFLNLEWSFDNYASSRVLGEGGLGWTF